MPASPRRERSSPAKRDALDAAAATHTQVKTGYDREAGSIETLRERRKLEDLEAATGRLEEASKRRGALPIPSEMVTGGPGGRWPRGL
jgi:hypothetical protein